LNGGWTAVIGEDWSQGRATFGGMVAALGNEAMRRVVPSDRALRGLETVFVGPAPAGTVRIETEILRVGKVVTIASARVWSADKIAATLTGIYGAARVAEMSILPTAAAGVQPPEEVPDLTGLFQRGAPSFVRHFDYRWAEGAPPFSSSPLNTSKTYLHHKDPSALTESHVVALIDGIPSVVLQRMNTVVPSSSLTWTIQFLQHDYSFPADGWWRIDAEVNSAASGYSCESCVLLDPKGSPAAIARQMVVFG
jgi:acyl-CoA thioesterase